MGMRFLLAAAAVSLSLSAQSTQPAMPVSGPANLLLAPAEDLVGKATFLRCLCADDKLSYNGAGEPVSEIKHPVEWTLAAINIEKVEQKDPMHVELSGTRSALRFNEYNKTFERRPLKLQSVRILVASENPSQLRTALDKIFSVGIDYRLQQSTSPLWKRYFNPALPWPDDGLKGKPVFQPSPKDTSAIAPKALKRAEFELTPEARQNRITGSILFSLVVDTDGTPRHIALVRPLGFGLDDAAATAVAKWRFAPATKDGQPIAQQITVEEKITPAAPRPVM